MKELFTFTQTIKELRKENKMTQKQVAEKLGITYQSYQAYEHGISQPTLENFIKIANIYDVSLDYLIGKSKY